MMNIGAASGVRITVLSDNRVTRPGGCFGEWGFSAYIEVKGGGEPIKILFDAGQSGDAVILNAKKMGIDLGKVDFIVISHRHYDHTGGLLKVLRRINKRVPVVAHPNLFKPSYAYGGGRLRSIGIPFGEREVRGAGADIIYARSPLKLGEGVVFTGEIPRRTEYERVEGFYSMEDGVLAPDEIPDDSALVVNLYKGGLVVITGCGHAGIINTINYAYELTRVRKYALILGGLHLAGEKPTSERFVRTLKELEARNIDALAPAHCSGTLFRGMVAQRTPKRFRDVGVCFEETL